MTAVGVFDRRHAYLIMAYNNWRQLGMLLELLDDPRNDIFIHIDKRSGEFPEDMLRSSVKFSGLTFIPRKKVYWADFSQTEVELDLMEAASGNGAYHYYHLLSGMCLPLKTQDEIHTFFANQDKEFIGMVRNGGGYSKKYANYYHPFLHNSVYRKCKPLKALDRAFMYMQKAAGFDRLKGQGLTISTGWTWFSITHRHCRHLLEHRDFINRVFRYTVASDELFMGTMVVNFGLEDRVFDINSIEKNDFAFGCKRLIDWERGRPYIWGAEGTEEDYKILMNSEYLFARKFDENVNFELIQRIYDTLKMRQAGEE
ncbi:MAG: hypothetical protein IJE81_00995 [Oscillospiraceae bacterium]|nr:hypothetical protein [Oscillospiraceae bacterium]